MPLGVHVAGELERKAIYVGGVLQLYFGIMGRRYDNPFFVDQINVDKFIHPLERERYGKFIPLHDNAAREAFAAFYTAFQSRSRNSNGVCIAPDRDSTLQTRTHTNPPEP